MLRIKHIYVCAVVLRLHSAIMYRAHCAQCGLAMHPARAMMQTGARESNVYRGGKKKYDHNKLTTEVESKGHQGYHGDDPAYVHQVESKEHQGYRGDDPAYVHQQHASKLYDEFENLEKKFRLGEFSREGNGKEYRRMVELFELLIINDKGY